MTLEVLIPAVLAGLAGLLATTALGVAGWALITITRLQQRVAYADATLIAHQNETGRRIVEAKEERERQFRDLRVEHSGLYDNVKSELKKIDEAVTRLHERFDETMKRLPRRK